MLSLFPELFNYSFLAIGVLRISVGIIFLWFAYIKTFKERADYLIFFEKLKMRPAKLFLNIAIVVELLIGAAFTAGYYTQIAALSAGVLMTLASLIKWHRPSMLHQNSVSFYFLTAVVSLALAFIGPGAFAFDLPL
ncbi:MAG: hypothetical protein A2937_02065 [Candidatus Yonathbacteria bacterium RIFCSPLOWO2_01_FULL_47_33b]|uniref:DoxX family protein n=1 Tax=Candidatus Yonathbacteria bacterium RIFCSPLOWO2_01_FULL_47_33b TaxID=1802727 RepID=A0A1G2SF01_9BACT|nr:MAG: hypothetical protein A2937_02065 [Candidatus Yonathbacteria bacterium RIFCSPLOWO2_01_FULL_47_33b]